VETEFIYAILSLVIISLISLVGVLTLSIGKKALNKILVFLVAFSAGSLLAAAFFDLIPESFEVLGNLNFVLVGIILFFVIEAVVHWHHPHCEDCETCVQPVVYLNLIGDAAHNFIDGIIIVAAFFVNIPAGIATTIAIALHEIPQEIGDFGVLVHSGLKTGKAILFNFISSIFALIGGILSYFFLSYFENAIPYVIALAAGGFIYIAAADLFPELHKETNKMKVLIQIFALLLGIGLIWMVFSLFPE